MDKSTLSWHYSVDFSGKKREGEFASGQGVGES